MFFPLWKFCRLKRQPIGSMAKYATISRGKLSDIKPEQREGAN